MLPSSKQSLSTPDAGREGIGLCIDDSELCGDGHRETEKMQGATTGYLRRSADLGIDGPPLPLPGSDTTMPPRPHQLQTRGATSSASYASPPAVHVASALGYVHVLSLLQHDLQFICL